MRTRRPPSPSIRRRRLLDRLSAAHRRWAVREPIGALQGSVLEIGGRQVDVTLDEVGVVRLEQHRRDAA